MCSDVAWAQWDREVCPKLMGCEGPGQRIKRYEETDPWETMTAQIGIRRVGSVPPYVRA